MAVRTIPSCTRNLPASVSTGPSTSSRTANVPASGSNVTAAPSNPSHCPVSGDHTLQGGSGPPSENDYSIAVKVSYGTWAYATAGDSDGEYNTSANGYTYNNIEAKLGSLFGDVDTLRANHHGSDHSSSQAYLNLLKPEAVFISCGANSYGHPGNRMLDALRSLVNDRGSGADIYLANNPCDPTQADGSTPTNYTGTFNHDGNVVLRTTNAGAG